MARRTPDAIIMCDTLGGHIDNNELPYEAAARESYEESAATIKIPPKVLHAMDRHNKFVDVPNYNEHMHDFRAYVVCVRNVHAGEYRRHVKHFLRNGPKHYAETDELVRFYMADVYQFIKNTTAHIMPDTNGHMRIITKRTQSILRTLHAEGML
jgi:8-oxo-dGTP pyrophosphatase MutT (NUDIX family)